MSTAPSLAREFSEAEYLAFADNVKPHMELVDGYLVEKHMGDRVHSRVQSLVNGMLVIWWMATRAGSTAVEGRARFPGPAGASHRLPDISYYAETSDSMDPVGSSLTPPTVAIEIRSESETLRVQQEKCRWYREHGVPVCWLIDPYARFAEVYDDVNDGTRVASDGVLSTPYMPGFSMDLKALFGMLDG